MSNSESTRSGSLVDDGGFVRSGPALGDRLLRRRLLRSLADLDGCRITLDEGGERGVGAPTRDESVTAHRELLG